MTRRALLVTGVILSAVALGYLLRGAVNQFILIPLAYLFWALKLLYLSLPQLVWWIAVILLVVFMLAYSLLPEIKPAKKQAVESARERGRVEELALAMSKSKKGTYFKWLVANRLGRLAYQILLQRANGKPRPVIAPLAGDGWQPHKDVQEYLEIGLHGSFADFPNASLPFLPPAKTPLDHDAASVVEFLESQMDQRSAM